jgi:hypothetical protein
MPSGDCDVDFLKLHEPWHSASAQRQMAVPILGHGSREDWRFEMGMFFL